MPRTLEAVALKQAIEAQYSVAHLSEGEDREIASGVTMLSLVNAQGEHIVVALAVDREQWQPLIREAAQEHEATELALHAEVWLRNFETPSERIEGVVLTIVSADEPTETHIATLERGENTITLAWKHVSNEQSGPVVEMLEEALFNPNQP